MTDRAQNAVDFVRTIYPNACLMRSIIAFLSGDNGLWEYYILSDYPDSNMRPSSVDELVIGSTTSNSEEAAWIAAAEFIVEHGIKQAIDG